jgi:hypothetical protein
VPSLDDPHVQQLFDESNLDARDSEKHASLLRTAVEAKHMSTSEVLVVSQVGGRLVMVCATGVVFVSQVGVFKKRIDVGELVPYDRIARLLSEDGGWKDRRESVIKALDETQTVLFELRWEGWTTGGTITASAAAAERDRVREALLHATKRP